MKKFIGIIIVFILVLSMSVLYSKFNNYKKKSSEKEYVSLMDFHDYKNIDILNIESIEIKKYENEEINSYKIDDRDKIKRVYNQLDAKLVGNEVFKSCNSQSTFYVFYMKDDFSFTIEIRCGLLFVYGKSYLLK